MVAKLNIAQMGASFHVGTLLQRVVHNYLSSGGLPSHIKILRSAYRARRDAMLEALDAHMSEVARWTRPEGVSLFGYSWRMGCPPVNFFRPLSQKKWPLFLETHSLPLEAVRTTP